MIYDAIMDATQPKPNAYLMTAVMNFLDAPFEMVKTAWEKVRSKPSEPTSEVDMKPPQIIEATEALAHFDKMEELKRTFFAPERPEVDLCFMSAFESYNAERLKFLQEHAETIASSSEVVFG